jgi:hypothetical protein
MSNEPRFRKWLNYDPATGAIRQAGFGYGGGEIEGFEYAELEPDVDVHTIGSRHRVDLSSIVRDGDGPPIVQLIEDTVQ